MGVFKIPIVNKFGITQLTCISKALYLEITNGPNVNSTSWTKLFEYQIIQII